VKKGYQIKELQNADGFLHLHVTLAAEPSGTKSPCRTRVQRSRRPLAKMRNSVLRACACEGTD